MKHQPTHTASKVAQLTGTPLEEIRRLIGSGDILVTRAKGRGRVPPLPAPLRAGLSTPTRKLPSPDYPRRHPMAHPPTRRGQPHGNTAKLTTIIVRLGLQPAPALLVRAFVQMLTNLTGQPLRAWLEHVECDGKPEL